MGRGKGMIEWYFYKKETHAILAVTRSGIEMLLTRYIYIRTP